MVRETALKAAVATLVVGGILLAYGVAAKVQAILVLLLISVVLATGIAPVVERLERRRVPRAAAILLVYLIVLLILLSIGGFIAALIVQQSVAFSHNLPDYISRAQELAGRYQARYAWLPDLGSLLEDARRQLGAIGQRVIGTVPAVFGFFGSVISLITILVITFYMMMAREQLRDGLLSFLPREHRERAREVTSEMGRRMGGWLRGQILLALIVGVAVSLALWLMGIPYAGLIGLVAALAELIPMIGPAVAMVPTILITLIGGSTWQLIASVIFFILLSQADANYLTPRIMQSQVGISPLTTIIALLVGAALLGVVGALLAIPIAAALQVLFTQIIAPAAHRVADGEENQGE